MTVVTEMECINIENEKVLLNSLEHIVKDILAKEACTFEGLKSRLMNTKLIDEVDAFGKYKYRDIDNALELVLTRMRKIEIPRTYKIGNISFDIKNTSLKFLLTGRSTLHYEGQILIKIDYKDYYVLKDCYMFLLSENVEPLKATVSLPAGYEMLKLKLKGELDCSKPIYYLFQTNLMSGDVYNIYQKIYKNVSDEYTSTSKLIGAVDNVQNLKITCEFCESMSLPINKWS